MNLQTEKKIVLETNIIVNWSKIIRLTNIFENDSGFEGHRDRLGNLGNATAVFRHAFLLPGLSSP